MFYITIINNLRKSESFFKKKIIFYVLRYKYFYYLCLRNILIATQTSNNAPS